MTSRYRQARRRIRSEAHNHRLARRTEMPDPTEDAFEDEVVELDVKDMPR